MSDDSTSSDATLWIRELFGHQTSSMNMEAILSSKKRDTTGASLPTDIFVPRSFPFSEPPTDDRAVAIDISSVPTKNASLTKRKHGALTAADDHLAPSVNSNDLQYPPGSLSSSRDTLDLHHVDYRVNARQQQPKLSPTKNEQLLIPFRQQDDLPNQGCFNWIPPPIGQPGESRRSNIVVPPDFAAMFMLRQHQAGYSPNIQQDQQQDTSFSHQPHQSVPHDQHISQLKRSKSDPSVTTATFSHSAYSAAELVSAQQVNSIEFLNHCNPVTAKMPSNESESQTATTSHLGLKSEPLDTTKMDTMAPIIPDWTGLSFQDSSMMNQSQSTTFLTSSSNALPYIGQQSIPPGFAPQVFDTGQRQDAPSTIPVHPPSVPNNSYNTYDIETNGFKNEAASTFNTATPGNHGQASTEPDAKATATTSALQAHYRLKAVPAITSTTLGAMESTSEDSSLETDVLYLESDKLRPIIQQPRDQDMLLGRGHSNFMHPGNQMLRMLVDEYREEYKRSRSRTEKTALTELAVQLAKSHDVVVTDGEAEVPPGRFLEYSKERQGWVEVDDERARSKVSHLFRARPRFRNSEESDY